MPCTYDDFGESARKAAETDRKQKDALDLATRLLCALTKRIPQVYIRENAELAQWVKDHADMDTKREKRKKSK